MIRSAFLKVVLVTSSPYLTRQLSLSWRLRASTLRTGLRSHSWSRLSRYSRLLSLLLSTVWQLLVTSLAWSQQLRIRIQIGIQQMAGLWRRMPRMLLSGRRPSRMLLLRVRSTSTRLPQTVTGQTTFFLQVTMRTSSSVQKSILLVSTTWPSRLIPMRILWLLRPLRLLIRSLYSPMVQLSITLLLSRLW